MKNQTQLDPKEYGIETEKAVTIEKSFVPKIAETKGYEEVYAQIITKEISKETVSEAYELRKKLVKVRTGIADIHKVEKQFYLQAGRFVDALKNKLTLPVTQMEEKLTEIENYYLNQEKERIAQLQKERVSLIEKYVDDAENLKLSDMAEDVFDAYLSAKKQSFEDRIAAEKKAEEDRIAKEKAEAEEREAQRLENIRLKKEAEEKEKALQKERAEALAKQREIEEKAKQEREKLETENAKKLKAEQDAKAKVEAELKAKKDAEEKARLEAEKKAEAEKKEAEKLAKAPIKTKLNNWVKSFELPYTDVDNETTNEIIQKFDAFKKWANTQIEQL